MTTFRAEISRPHKDKCITEIDFFAETPEELTYLDLIEEFESTVPDEDDDVDDMEIDLFVKRDNKWVPVVANKGMKPGYLEELRARGYETVCVLELGDLEDDEELDDTDFVLGSERIGADAYADLLEVFSGLDEKKLADAVKRVAIAAIDEAVSGKSTRELTHKEYLERVMKELKNG